MFLLKGFLIRMKKLFILIAIMFFVSTACGSGQTDTAPEYLIGPPQDIDNAAATAAPAPDTEPSGDDNATSGDSPENDEPQAPAEFFFKMGDVIIEMNQNIDHVISKVGEPLGVFEAPSCAFDGTDRIFSYPGLQIYTYPVGDEDFIHTIGFFDDSVRTAEGGIRLGAGLQAVIDAYGEDFIVDTGMYKFTRGLTSLEFLVDDDMVIGISYGYKIEQ